MKAKFDAEKALEVLLYIVKHAPIPDRFHICKILYFADKYHLERYLRLICGENYSAMPHGPVPSGVYDIIKAADREGGQDILADDLLVRGLRLPRMEVFSETDTEALDWAIQKYGRMPFPALRRASHDDIWNTATANGHIFEESQSKGSVPIPIDVIAKNLIDGDLILDYLQEYAY